MNEIVIQSPVDMHAHLRQDDMLRHVVPLTTPTWAGVLAMPNTDPPLTTIQQLIDYHQDAVDAATGKPFQQYLTLYFQTSYTRELLVAVKEFITSIKFYPKNLTTNSHHGCDPEDPAILDVLALMEELQIPLCVHPEAEGYYHDRELLFARHIGLWARRFPNLKIIMEHLSDRHSLLMLEAHPNVYATVTPQHLLTTGNDWFGPPFDPHLYCMPCVKRPEDRESLAMAVTGKCGDKIMAGTDSAPHTENRKVQCGCAGVFSAPIALQLYTQVFDRMNSLDRLQAFVSDNARRIYGIQPPAKEVRLVRKPFVIPERYGDLIPMWAGRTIDWSVEE